MFKSLNLWFFQNHIKRRIDFDKYVTTIIGRNDAGKSAIIRAIRYICLNQPKGTSFIGRGAEKTRLILRVDRRKIKRVRSKKENAYYLDGRKFKAFGLGKVPDNISKLLNVGEVNFQRQLDPPFWFLETAGQVSKNLNAIINLSAIDKSLDNIAKKLRKANNHAEVSKDRLKTAKEELKQLDWVKDCDMDLDQVLMAKKRHSSLSDKRSRIEDLLDRLKGLTQRRKTLQRAVKEGLDVVGAGDQGSKRQTQANTLEQLVRRYKKYKQLSNLIVPDISDLISAKADCDKSAEDRRDMEYMVTQYMEALKWREAKELELNQAQKSLTKLIGKRCPTCGRILGKEHIHPSSQSERPTGTYRQKPR